MCPGVGEGRLRRFGAAQLAICPQPGTMLSVEAGRDRAGVLVDVSVDQWHETLQEPPFSPPWKAGTVSELQSHAQVLSAGGTPGSEEPG